MTSRSQDPTPHLYSDLASWFHLLTAPEDYAEEAKTYRRALVEACELPPRTVLELGSGGGNNASHMKAHFDMTLVDLSPQMLDLSRGLNPELEHIEGDMRTVRLGREFDAVFIHDAIVYMATEADLRSAMETAFVHCRPGGAAFFAPDHTRENFRPSTSHGGHDGQERSLRYLEWKWDTDPADDTYTHLLVYALREAGGSLRIEHDETVCGLSSRETWLRLLTEAGFQPKVLPFEHSEIEPGAGDFFVATRPS